VNRGSLVPAAVILTTALVLAAGCGDKKRTIVGPEHQPALYPILSSPQNALAAMVLSYQRRDSTETKLIYDDAYQGTSVDQTDPSPVVLRLYKADEVRHVVALAKRVTITGVSIMFPPVLERFTDAGDPPGWATILVANPRIEIDDQPVSYSTASSGETMEFKFVPTTPDSTSPTDTTWKIIQWFELKN